MSQASECHPLVGLGEGPAKNTKDKNLLWKEDQCIGRRRTTSCWSAPRIQKTSRKGIPAAGRLFPPPGSFFNEKMLTATVTARDGHTLMNQQITGRVRFFGENLGVTNDLAKRITKLVRESF